MSERPILFSAPMVRAILAGTKTVTRRIVKPQPDGVDGATWVREGTGHVPCRDELSRGALDQIGPTVWSPYGVPGDRLWVRETWRPFMEAWDGGVEYADGARCSHDRERIEAFPKLSLRFPGANAERHSDAWRPSIHMPRWASRILLDVVSVRVERLHEITEDDARAEGFVPGTPMSTRFEITDLDGSLSVSHGTSWHSTARAMFVGAWTALNGKRAPWSSNPWVWRVEFRRCADVS